YPLGILVGDDFGTDLLIALNARARSEVLSACSLDDIADERSIPGDEPATEEVDCTRRGFVAHCLSHRPDTGLHRIDDAVSAVTIPDEPPREVGFRIDPLERFPEAELEDGHAGVAKRLHG